MLQTGIVTRHAYNAKTRLQTQAEYCNKVGYQHKLHLQDGKLKREAALLQGRVLTTS